MKFNEHITKEALTITNFCTGQQEIKLNKLNNEGFSCYDAVITSASTITNDVIYGMLEAKTRHIDSDTYDGGILLQLDKLASIKAVLNKAQTDPKNINKRLKAFYLTRYNDYTYLFDLDTVNYGKLITKLLPKNTASDGSTEWIYKDVFLLQPSDAVVTVKTV